MGEHDGLVSHGGGCTGVPQYMGEHDGLVSHGRGGKGVIQGS